MTNWRDFVVGRVSPPHITLSRSVAQSIQCPLYLHNICIRNILSIHFQCEHITLTLYALTHETINVDACICVNVFVSMLVIFSSSLYL